MKVLVDICVIVDVPQNRAPFAADAQAVFLAVASKQIQACVTAKSVFACGVYVGKHTSRLAV